MHDADAILIATHSQGSVVPTQLLDRLILDNHIRAPGGSPPPPLQTGRSQEAMQAGRPVSSFTGYAVWRRVGPLKYLKSISLVKPYIQVGTSLECIDWNNSSIATFTNGSDTERQL